MKRKKLLRKIKSLLNADQRAQIKKFDSLEKVLQKLESKEADFHEKLKQEKSKARREELHRKLEVIQAQRKKGVRLKTEIEKLRDDE
jgi:hypothetical protein